MSAEASPFVLLVDTREQRIPPFPDEVIVERWTLDAGDYATPSLQGRAVVERKSPSDFAGSITRDRERFEDELRRLQSYWRKFVVVEGGPSDVLRASKMGENSLTGTCASLAARWDSPVLFAGNPTQCARLIVGILMRLEKRLPELKALAPEGSAT